MMGNLKFNIGWKFYDIRPYMPKVRYEFKEGYGLYLIIIHHTTH